jgi:hypothetical protein
VGRNDVARYEGVVIDTGAAASSTRCACVMLPSFQGNVCRREV